MASLLELNTVGKSFGKVEALKDISFKIERGEIIGLVGDNGAGKSTLIKILSGIFPADCGRILFEGKEVKITSPRAAMNLGIETIHQDMALAPEVSIYRNIFMGRETTTKFGFLNHKRMEAEARRLLEEYVTTGLRSPRELVRNLSGGQRQAVAIARAMYFKAKILLLDEPTSALSVKESQEVLDFTRRLRDDGISSIFVTHNLYHIHSIADRFIVLYHGRKVADIRKEQVNIDELAQLVIRGDER